MRNQNRLFDSLDDLDGTPTAEDRGRLTAQRLVEPDPEQQDRALQWTPELSLMLAILEDAIACYTKTLKRPRQNPEILARQAEFWIRLDDWDSPFSFNNICEALMLDARATRERILATTPCESA
jgi:hypothetical protein